MLMLVLGVTGLYGLMSMRVAHLVRLAVCCQYCRVRTADPLAMLDYRLVIDSSLLLRFT